PHISSARADAKVKFTFSLACDCCYFVGAVAFSGPATSLAQADPGRPHPRHKERTVPARSGDSYRGGKDQRARNVRRSSAPSSPTCFDYLSKRRNTAAWTHRLSRTPSHFR